MPTPCLIWIQGVALLGSNLIHDHHPRVTDVTVPGSPASRYPSLYHRRGLPPSGDPYEASLSKPKSSWKTCQERGEPQPLGDPPKSPLSKLSSWTSLHCATAATLYQHTNAPHGALSEQSVSSTEGALALRRPLGASPTCRTAAHLRVLVGEPTHVFCASGPSLGVSPLATLLFIFFLMRACLPSRHL